MTLLLALFACSQSVLPEGELAVATEHVFSVQGSVWELVPSAAVVVRGAAVEVQLSEKWSVPDRPAFELTCPVEVELLVLEDAQGLLRGQVHELDDRCGVGAYAIGDSYVFRFVEYPQALVWLEESTGISQRWWEEERARLAPSYGQPVDLFLFWGPDPSTLWPIGHVYQPEI